MHDQLNLRRADAEPRQQRVNPAFHRQRRVRGHARFLVKHQAAAGQAGDDEVGKGTADIDANAVAEIVHVRMITKLPIASTLADQPGRMTVVISSYSTIAGPATAEVAPDFGQGDKLVPLE